MAVAAVILAAVPLRAAEVQGDVNQSFKVKEKGVLTLNADLGSVEIRTHRKATVNVDVRFEPRRDVDDREFKSILRDMDLEMTGKNGDVDIRLEYKRGSLRVWDGAGRYVRVSFLITVPEVYNVNVKTSGGSIQVRDLTGEVMASTSGGSLKFGNIQGPVKGRTSGGSIELQSCKGNAEVKTSGGSIHLGKVEGDVYAKTSGGRIAVEEVLGRIEAATSGGSIEASISRPPRGNCRLTTSGGSITVYLAGDAGVDLDAATSGGRVSTDFPVTVQGVISKRSLRAGINGGGPQLFLRTSGGNIYLKQL